MDHDRGVHLLLIHHFLEDYPVIHLQLHSLQHKNILRTQNLIAPLVFFGDDIFDELDRLLLPEVSDDQPFTPVPLEESPEKIFDARGRRNRFWVN